VDALAPPHRSRLATPRRLLRLRSDAALAERYAEGDEAAFAILYERHRASVLAVCMGVLGSRPDAEDATQESFAALAISLRSSPPRELRAWLTRVARNAAIDVARRRRSRASVDGEIPEDGDWCPDGVTSSHTIKDELHSVMAGIRELPESQRTALLMRELAGHSYREIADLLELDEDAVRGLIARARIGLRHHRDAAELPCAAAREAIAAEPDGRRHDKAVRRHVRGCAACRSYRHALRDDARALKGLVALPAGGFAGGSAVVGGLAAKGALLGTAVTQVTAACAVSVCAVGGIVLLSPGTADHDHAGRGGAAAHRRAQAGRATAATSARDRIGAAGSAAAAAHASGTAAHSISSAGLAGGAQSATSGVTHGSLPSATIPGRSTVPAHGGVSHHFGGWGSRPGASSLGGHTGVGKPSAGGNPSSPGSGTSAPPAGASGSGGSGGSGSSGSGSGSGSSGSGGSQSGSGGSSGQTYVAHESDDQQAGVDGGSSGSSGSTTSTGSSTGSTTGSTGSSTGSTTGTTGSTTGTTGSTTGTTGSTTGTTGSTTGSTGTPPVTDG
jgi:RNA polymerase sigma factor (sigma-70 family)